MISYLLLDLDGTVTDSSEGITNSAAYALSQFDIEVTDKSSLNRFIGPPLIDSFIDFYGFTEEQAKAAVFAYRVYYRERGIYENRVYAGMREFLAAAKDAGYQLVLATSKPEVFAKQILEHFDLMQYFAYCCGSELDGRRSKKAEVIRYAMETAGITDPADAVMIGDRNYDIIGAHACGMKAIGVLFGFGDRAEMEQAGADWIVESPSEMADLTKLWRVL